MALRDGSTLINRWPYSKAPGTPDRLSQQPTEGAQEQALGEIIVSLRDAVMETIKFTEWPDDSKEAARLLIDTVRSSPDIPNNTNNLPQHIRDLAEKYLQVLEDVHTRLKDATSKTGIKNWKIYHTIRSIASKRRSKCNLLFQTCQDDVAQAANSLRERLDSERAKERCPEAMRPRADERIQLKAPCAKDLDTPPGDFQSNPAGNAIVTPSSTSGPNPGSADPEDEESRSPVGTEALNMARKTFKTVEAVFGSIPVVGNFAAAAAKVGLAFVETIEIMDKNDDLAKDLGGQTTKLSHLLESVTGQPKEGERELIANHITKLHKYVGIDISERDY
ncbi:hypothetical protein FS837_002784 [Tulasnella sp. UAMH 9824]|nr:hypothetical protein FS837_002784 [Tulasnella sp. UAMH 9824]